MSEDRTGIGGNGGLAADHLCSFVSRVERLEEEIKELQDGKKEIYAEAKATGFDVKVLKKVIQRRRKERDQVQEEDAVLQLYEDIINGTLGRAKATQKDPLDD